MLNCQTSSPLPVFKFFYIPCYTSFARSCMSVSHSSLSVTRSVNEMENCDSGVTGDSWWLSLHFKSSLASNSISKRNVSESRGRLRVIRFIFLCLFFCFFHDDLTLWIPLWDSELRMFLWDLWFPRQWVTLWRSSECHAIHVCFVWFIYQASHHLRSRVSCRYSDWLRAGRPWGVGVRVPVGWKFFTSSYRPDRLWDPPNLL
jgi:hypothetical protein